jgi:NAD(P)-dependent dehydrogenase (short-subunit alcohol dehydrogenase family)
MEGGMIDKNSFDLSGKVALITGGGYGIGRSIGEMLVDFGADVAIADIKEELAKETGALLSKFGHRTLAIKADVSNSADVENMVRTTVEKLGAIDILANNAGVLVGNAPIHETTEET